MSYETTYPDELQQLISMGYDPTMAQNALEASGGNVETALEIIAGDQTEEAKKLHAYEGQKASAVVDQWSQQVFGEHHPQVKARAQQASDGASSAWKQAVSKWKQVDERYQISSGAKDTIKSVDQKLKNFDQKHDWSNKVTMAASNAGTALNKTYQNAKKSMEETRQDGSVGSSTPGGGTKELS